MSGLLKTIGAQFQGAIMNLLGFYVIGMPIGISLLLATRLEDFGIIDH